MYTITINTSDIDNNINLTAQNIEDETLINEDSFINWFNDNVDLEDYQSLDDNDDYIPLTDNELQDAKIDSVDEFKSSSDYYEWEESCQPMVNVAHILQNEPSEEALRLVSELVGNVAIYELQELEAYAILLTGCGMDLSDNLELAYYIIDGKSPIEARQIMSLSPTAEKLLLWCREEKDVYVNKIIKWLKEYRG